MLVDSLFFESKRSKGVKRVTKGVRGNERERERERERESERERARERER